MGTSSRIFWNAVSKWLATLASAGMSVILVPFLLVKLGTDGFGLSALVGVIVSLSALADLGLQAALTRQLAAELHRRDPLNYRRLYASAVVLFVTIGTVMALVCAAFSEPLARAFRVGADLMPQAQFVIRYYASTAVFMSLIRPAYTAVLASHDRFDRINHATTVTSLLRGGLLLGVLGFTASGLYGWAAVCFATSLLELAVLRQMARRQERGLEVRPRLVRLSALRSLFSMGGYFVMIKVIGMLGVHSHPIVLTTYLGPGSVAFYRPPGMLSGLGRAIVLAMSQQLHPLATQYHVTGNRSSLQEVLIRGTRYTFLIGIGACGFMILFSEPIIWVWLHKELGQHYMIAVWLLVWFAVSDLFEYAGGSQGSIMVGMNKLRFSVALNLPLAIGNLVASILLVRYTSLGVLGVIVPTVVNYGIRRIVETAYMARVTGVGLGRYLREAYVRPLAVLALLLAAGWALRMFWRPTSMVQLGMAAVGTTAVWAALCWGVGFGSVDRASFRKLVSRLRSRGKAAGVTPPVEAAVVAASPTPASQTGAEPRQTAPARSGPG